MTKMSGSCPSKMKRCSPCLLEFSRSIKAVDIVLMILLSKDKQINMSGLYFVNIKFYTRLEEDEEGMKSFKKLEYSGHAGIL